jgi:hypothetical protein
MAKIRTARDGRRARTTMPRHSHPVRATLENKAFAARAVQKNLADTHACDMLRAESHASEHFFRREFLQRGVE